MFCVSIELQAKPGREAEVEALFREYIPVVEQLPGCIRFELHRSAKDPSRFLLYELYESHDALLLHRSDPLFAVWRPRIAELEVSRSLAEWDTLIAGGVQ